jgi:hypothetical protein
VTAKTLFSELAARGVVLKSADEKLLFDAPTGVLTDDDRAELRRLKPELMLLLSTPTAPPADDRTARRDRIRTLAASVSPGELLRQRKRISSALRRVCSAEEIHELILVQCLLARGIEPHGLLKREAA